MLGRGFLGVRARAGLTAASWFALAGCSSPLWVAPANAPKLVGSYRRTGESVIVNQGYHYAIRREQQPRLRITAWRDRPSPVPGRPPDAPGAPTTRVAEQIDAPFEHINAVGDTLYFRYARPVRLYDVGRVELRIDGEPLLPLPKLDTESGKRPLSERGNFVGMQIAGNGYFHFVYRRRLFEPLLLELGAFAFGLNGAGLLEGSAGLLVDVPLAGRVSVYGGGGGTANVVFGGESDEGVSASGVSIVYARLGFALRVGAQKLDQVGVEGALWSGVFHDEGHDRHILWVVPGFVWMHAL